MTNDLSSPALRAPLARLKGSAFPAFRIAGAKVFPTSFRTWKVETGLKSANEFVYLKKNMFGDTRANRTWNGAEEVGLLRSRKFRLREGAPSWNGGPRIYKARMKLRTISGR